MEGALFPCAHCGHVHRAAQCDLCECNNDFPNSDVASFDPDIPTAQELGFPVQKRE
jgi:hypothetical protein